MRHSQHNLDWTPSFQIIVVCAILDVSASLLLWCLSNVGGAQVLAGAVPSLLLYRLVS